MTVADDAAFRRLAWILIWTAACLNLGRILCAERVYEPSNPGRWPAERPRPMPTFSSNDRSRWATVRALVDGDGPDQPPGRFIIGRRDRGMVLGSLATALAAADPLQAALLAEAGYRARTRADSGIIFEDGWQSVDKILDPSSLEFYSSKPPFLATLLAGFYWILQQLFGWTLADQPQFVVRTLLVVLHILPLVLYLWLVVRLSLRHLAADWARLFVLAAACFGTLLTPFLLSLNNHTLGAFCVLFTMVLVLRVWERRCAGRDPGYVNFALAGLLAAFAVTNELPALAFLVGILVLLALWYPYRALLLFLPAAMLVGAGFLGTNYWALGTWKPAYSHFGDPWYEYEGSHWRKPPPGQIKNGIDWAYFKETRGEYAFHLLLGHHGFFSLTPLWLLSLATMAAGSWRWLRAGLPLRGPPAEASIPSAATPPAAPLPGWLPPFTLGLTVVVVGFYLLRSDNYGGWSNGPRWLLWLTPLLLLCLMPALDRLQRTRAGRWFAYLCLGFSVLAANYVLWNPWRMPWIYDFMQALGWPGY